LLGHPVYRSTVDLLSASIIVGAVVVILVGRWLLHRWQDKHWDERHKADANAQDQFISEARDARAAGNMLSKFPNVGGDWTKKR
jgi:hypothetical protein